MGRYLECWTPAAAQLGIEVRGPLSVDLPNGDTLKAQLHVPDFGARKGMLVFEDIPDRRASDALIELGYGYSVFGPPSTDEVATKEDLAEVLKDWGWSGSASEAPDWV